MTAVTACTGRTREDWLRLLYGHTECDGGAVTKTRVSGPALGFSVSCKGWNCMKEAFRDSQVERRASTNIKHKHRGWTCSTQGFKGAHEWQRATEGTFTDDIDRGGRRGEGGGVRVLPPLRPTPVPLCVMDIIMGTDHLKKTKRWQFKSQFEGSRKSIKKKKKPELVREFWVMTFDTRSMDVNPFPLNVFIQFFIWTGFCSSPVKNVTFALIWTRFVFEGSIKK